LEPHLVLGPVLRRVAGDRATIWMETSQPAAVEVRAGDAGGSVRTFSAYGHHYALVRVDGLPAAGITPYRVYLDGRQAWPRDADPYPPPVIRTRAPDAPVRVLFGSCRESSPLFNLGLPPDALDAYAVRLSEQVKAHGVDAAAWPDLLMLLGDQVYADIMSPNMKRFLAGRAAERGPDAPDGQVVDFSEYTHLYLDSWTDPDVRWLLSTVPSVMVFDDHEIIDDWNISAAWRADIAREPWWTRRISAGLSSYWVYQHLGNLAPDDLDKDPVIAAVTQAATAGGDATGVLGEFGERADRDRGSYQWSYSLDVGRTRIVVLDNRAGRQLEPGRRGMLLPETWGWLEAQLTGDFDHVLIGSSLPWLMPPAVHHLESANERLCESPRGFVARRAEKVRRAVDLEHWAAFRASFDALTDLLARVADREGAPATVCVLSGDVHHSYVARAELPTRSPVYQLTCSPVHNALPGFMKPAMRFSWSRAAALIGRSIARAAGVPPPSVRWRRLAGPVYANALTEIVQDGRAANVRIVATDPDKTLREAAALDI
jgi:hypothetical protein